MKIKYTPPEYLHDDAKKYIKEVIKSLNDKAASEKIDLGALHMLAINYDTFLRASEKIARDGLVVEGLHGAVKHPLIKVATDAQIQAMKVMTEFGLTVKSRNNIKSVQPEEKETAFEKFVKGKQRK